MKFSFEHTDVAENYKETDIPKTQKHYSTKNKNELVRFKRNLRRCYNDTSLSTGN